MRKRRKAIKNIMSATTKIILSAIVFYLSFSSVPLLQAFWQKSGVMSVVFNSESGSKLHQEKYAVIGDSVIELEIVSSLEDRTAGLSNRTSLKSNTGMWFVFDSNDYHGIWMKDMNFSIDILWVDKHMKVVHIEENVSPDTYPDVFKPSSVSRYVLEIPAGQVKKIGVKISDQVDLF